MTIAGYKIPLKVILLIAAIVLVLSILIFSASNRRSAIDFNSDAVDPVEGDPPGAGFRPKNEATLIYEDLTVFPWHPPSAKRAFERILGYNDNELIAVWNAYRNRYYDKRYQTLGDLVRSEWTVMYTETYYAQSDAIKRLDELSLS